MKYILLFIIISAVACSKSGFLDTNPNPSLVVPASLDDYQAILNNDLTMNGEAANGLVPVLGETGAGDYYLTDDYYNGYLSPLYKRAYIWATDVFNGEQIYDWNIPYQSIDKANVVLDGLSTLKPSPDQPNKYNTILGSALFYRAHLFYHLAQIFAQPYTADSASILPGIPLRLTSSVTEPVGRASLQDTYVKIISDLSAASALLPAKQVYATQPGKTACYALLARTYLTMQNYPKALLYADSTLQLDNQLMDYNAVDSTAYFPFTVLNEEAIFQCEMIKGPILAPVNPNYFLVDSSLYRSYDNNDLRKTLFFRPASGAYLFKGSYSGYNKLFAGIATDEVYLIHAECEERAGNHTQALNDLNILLEKRYKTGTYIAYTIANTQDVLGLILAERRKELCFRGLRWIDLRRLNKEGANITLYRQLDGITYKLPPNDDRYTYPIPASVINLNPGMVQNNR